VPTKQADLHVHTHFSDGTFSPKEVVECAVKKGLNAIAITDHDCVDGIDHAIKYAEGTGLEIIPGIEFTTELDNREIHILGYFIDYKQGWFIKELEQLCQMRDNRMNKMLECLSKYGVSITMDEVKKISGEGSSGRLHLATLLLKKGYVKSMQEAFDKFLGNGKACYVQGDRISPIKAISIISKLKGVAVLAHPFTVGKDELIPIFAKAGLKGIEVYHTDHNKSTSGRYEKIAQDLGLLKTGGSDCHGMNKGRVLMGTVTVPYSVVDKLKSFSG